MIEFVLIFHQLVCAPDLASQVMLIKQQSPDARVDIVDGYGDWELFNCVLIERHVETPTASTEI